MPSVLKTMDVLVPPVRDDRHKSKLGGCLLLLVPIITGIYCYSYITSFFHGRARYGIAKMGVSEVGLEVSDWGNRGVELKLQCISSQGCYYSPPGRSEDDGEANGCEAAGQRVVATKVPGANYTKEIVLQKQCYYVAKGEMLPKDHSCLLYDTDPFNTFTVSWMKSDLFGLAVESQIFHEECLNKPCPMVSKDWIPLFRGISMLAMVETIDNRDSEERIARQYNPTIVSSAGLVEPEFNYCFREGGEYPDCAKCKNCPNCGAPRVERTKVHQLHIRPFPSYIAKAVRVKYPTEIFGLVGGFVSVLMGIFASVVYVRLVIRTTFGGKRKETTKAHNVSPPPNKPSQQQQQTTETMTLS